MTQTKTLDHPSTSPTLGWQSRSLIQIQGAAAALALIVAAVHVIDQGGIVGNKDPRYVGIGYWVLELVAIATAVVLMRSANRLTWLVALGVGVGPLIGFILSRGPGLPNYTDDRGNWGEPLGIVSLIIEGLLIVVSLVGLAATNRRSFNA